MAFHTQQQLQQQQAQHQEYLRQLALSQQRFYERQMFEAVYNPQQIATSASTSGGGGNPNADTPVAADTQFLLSKVVSNPGNPLNYPFNNLVRLRTDGSLYDFVNSPPSSPSLNAFTNPAGSPFNYFTSVDATPGLSGPFPTAFTLNTWNPNTGEIQTLTQTDGPAIPPYGSMSLHYQASNDTFLYLANWYYGQLDYQIALYEIAVADGSYTVTGVAEYESPNNSNQFMPVSIMDLGHVLEGGIKDVDYQIPAGVLTGPYTPDTTYYVTPTTNQGGQNAIFKVDIGNDGNVSKVSVDLAQPGSTSGFGYTDGDTWTISGGLIGQIDEPWIDISGTFSTQQVPCLTSFYQVVPNGPGSVITTFVVELSPYDYTPVNNQFNTYQQLEIINHPWDSAKILYVIGTTQDPNGDIFFNLYCEKLDVTKDWPDNYIGDVFCVARLVTNQPSTPQLEFQYEYQWADPGNVIYLGLSKPNI